MFQKKVCHYIFGNNLNKNCPIAIIFGMLITRTIGHRKVVSLSPPHLVCATILPWKTHNTKIHVFRIMHHVSLREKKLGHLFIPTFLQLFSCSKCRPCTRYTHTRFQPLSSLTDSLVNDVRLQTIPDINEALLQLIAVVQTAFAQSLLRDSPNILVGGVKV